MLFGGAQATSVSCLVNTIPSQNFYEGVRLWSSMIFFDVPKWEENSDKVKYVVNIDTNTLLKDARLL